MEPITIFTTTYNRSAHLRRLFKSIQAQTCQNLIWLIVDDGSIDDTADVVKGFKTEASFKIEYMFKSNGGKHTAMKLGFEKTHTKYMVEIDDDDELHPDAIETFFEVWKSIEKEQKDNIAEVRALSVNENGVVCGSCHPAAEGKDYYDSNYLTEDWYKNRHSENITSWRMDLVKALSIFDIEKEWLYPQVKLVSESLFWNRIARRYDTRYINKPLRVYHSDAEDSITSSLFTKQKCYNYVFSLRIIINELSIQGWRNPIHLLKYFVEYMSCGTAIRIGTRNLLQNIDALYNRFACALSLPFALCGAIYLRKNFGK